MLDKKIPEEVDKLKDDLIWAYIFRNQFEKLFKKGEKRIELLNATAPQFFAFLQRMFWEQMILGVARLTDPYERGSNKNLSVQMLPHLASTYKWDFLEDIQNLEEKALKNRKQIKTWRHKLLAHRDLPTARSNAVRLEKVSLWQIDATLEPIGRALNLIYSSLNNSSWSWQAITSSDADELVHNLKLAMIYRDMIESDRDPRKETEEWMQSRFRDA